MGSVKPKTEKQWDPEAERFHAGGHEVNGAGEGDGNIGEGDGVEEKDGGKKDALRISAV